MTTRYLTTTDRARFLLLGDSHAGAVGRAAREAGLPFAGGPIGSGRDLLGPFFDPSGEDDITFRDAESEHLYRGFLDQLDTRGLGRLTVPLVCTFGLSVHTVATAANWSVHRDVRDAYTPGFLRSEHFGDLVRATAGGALAFYDRAVALGLRTLALLPPQRVPGMADPQVFFAAQDVLHEELRARGIETVDLRAHVTAADGLQRAPFCEPDDTIHGSLAFGRLIVAALLDRGL